MATKFMCQCELIMTFSITSFVLGVTVFAIMISYFALYATPEGYHTLGKACHALDNHRHKKSTNPGAPTPPDDICKTPLPPSDPPWYKCLERKQRVVLASIGVVWAIFHVLGAAVITVVTTFLPRLAHGLYAKIHLMLTLGWLAACAGSLNAHPDLERKDCEVSDVAYITPALYPYPNKQGDVEDRNVHLVAFSGFFLITAFSFITSLVTIGAYFQDFRPKQSIFRIIPVISITGSTSDACITEGKLLAKASPISSAISGRSSSEELRSNPISAEFSESN